MASGYETGLRVIALASFPITIYVLFGSLMFPAWWYGLFWGPDARLRYVKDGTANLIDHYFRLSINLILLFSATVLSIVKWRARLFPWIDHFAGWLIFCCALAILLDALFLRRFQRTAYNKGMAAMVQLRTTLEQLVGVLRAGPNVDSPIFFRYIDRPRVDALYSQVAELRLKERSVTKADTQKAKAELGFGTASLGVEKSGDRQRTDTLEAPDLSAERKCAELVRHLLETRPRNCYADSLDWCLRELGNELSEPVRLLLQRPSSEASLGTVAKPNDKFKGYLRVLEQGLRQANGLTLVYGEFERSERTLIRTFSDERFKCHFRVTLPQDVLDSLPAGKLDLTVFGSVIRPLGSDGIVDVAAVAVF